MPDDSPLAFWFGLGGLLLALLALFVIWANNATDNCTGTEDGNVPDEEY